MRKTLFLLALFALSSIQARASSVYGVITNLYGTPEGYTDQTVPGSSINYAELVTSDPNNPFGAGDYDFVLQLFNYGSSTATSITLAGFSGYETQLGFTNAGYSPSPTAVANPDGSVTFSFNETFGDGTTDPYVIYSNAKSAVFSDTAVTVGGIGDNAELDPPGYTPTAISSTPEPSSIKLLATGVLGAAGAARQRLRMKR